MFASLLVATTMARNAEAQDARPRFGVETTATAGWAANPTLDGTGAIGIDLAFRIDPVKLGGFATYGLGDNGGKASTLGVMLGGVVPLGYFDLDLFALGGRHEYFSIGAVDGGGGYGLDFGPHCPYWSGVGAALPFAGAAVGLHRAARPGSHFLFGVVLYYLHDLGRAHESRHETIECSGGLFAPSTSQRRDVDADLGSQELGIRFRFGFDASE